MTEVSLAGHGVEVGFGGLPLSACPVGVVPIVWNNVDLPDLRKATPSDIVIQNVGRLDYEGLQHGAGFPRGSALIEQLEAAGLRLAEVYAALDCDADGPSDGALDAAAERLRLLSDAGGDVLVIALTIDERRAKRAARASAGDTPRLTDIGWQRLGHTLTSLGEKAMEHEVVPVFHPHLATFIETPQETERLMEVVDGTAVGLCLDVGHYLAAGGDPVSVIRDFGERITHVHLKDVDPDVLDSLRSGRIPGFLASIRQRLFTELGAGMLDLRGVLSSLDSIGYSGWLMVEQDSTWLEPSEAAAIGRRVLEYAIRTMDSGDG